MATASTDSPPSLQTLADELSGEGLLIGDLVRSAPAAPATLGTLVASGPHTREQAGVYARVVECVREGYLLHYGHARLIEAGDPDLALLAGDYLYARGIALLAGLGDLAAVAALAELISASAELHADGSPDAGERLAVLWLATATAIACGPTDADRDAAERLRAGGSAEALYAHVATAAAQAGLGERLIEAAETVGFSPLKNG